MRALWILALILATALIVIATLVVIAYRGTRLGIATLHQLPRYGARKVME